MKILLTNAILLSNTREGTMIGGFFMTNEKEIVLFETEDKGEVEKENNTQKMRVAGIIQLILFYRAMQSTKLAGLFIESFFY